MDLFAFRINYDKPEFKGSFPALYNGNISETIWRTSSDDHKRQYVYRYDNLNRLLDAAYIKNYNPDKGTFSVINAYNENLKYDKNGNILSLSRTGKQDLSSNAMDIDILTYTYQADTNLLTGVKDSSNDPLGFTDGNTSGNDYAYDSNWNMIKDLNKGINSITYNFLNLPVKITSYKGTIEYIYDASGNKMQKLVTQAGKSIATLYLGGFQYENNLLQFFPQAEGCVKTMQENSSMYIKPIIWEIYESLILRKTESLRPLKKTATILSALNTQDITKTTYN